MSIQSKGKWYDLQGQGGYAQEDVVKNVRGIFRIFVSLVWNVSLEAQSIRLSQEFRR